MSSLFKKLFMAMLLAIFGVQQAMADNNATSLMSALPDSLIPDELYSVAGLVFLAIIALSGIFIGIKLLKKARG